MQGESPKKPNERLKMKINYEDDTTYTEYIQSFCVWCVGEDHGDKCVGIENLAYAFIKSFSKEEALQCL